MSTIDGSDPAVGMVVHAKSQSLNRANVATTGSNVMEKQPHAGSVLGSSTATTAMTGNREASTSHDGIAGVSLPDKVAGDEKNNSQLREPGGHATSTLEKESSQEPPPQSSDVLFGTVTKQRWPGNSFFNRLVQRRRDSGDLSAAAAEIAEHVRGKGGRFFYCSVVDGHIQYKLCTEEQTKKYTLRHLCSAAHAKTFSASTAAFLQALYSTPESSATPQVTPPPLAVNAEAIGVLMGDVDPNGTRMGITGPTGKISADGSYGDTGSKQDHPPNAYGQTYPASYRYPYPSSHFPPPPYPYYQYHHYPLYPPPPLPRAKAKAARAPPQKTTKDDASAAKTDPACDDELSELGSQMSSEPSPMSLKSTSSSASKSSRQKSSSSKVRQAPTASPKTAGATADPGRTDCVIDPLTGIVHTGLPRGVTVRPSGKWQAQIYFAGRSRYIGVFEDPLMASVAYSVSYQMVKALKARRKEFEHDPQGNFVPESNRLIVVVRSLSNQAAHLFKEEVNKLNESTRSGKMKSIQAAYEFAKKYVELHTPKDFGS